MSTDDKEKALAELKRRYRVADMMISMHSILRDSYRRRAISLDAVLFSSAVVIATLAFGDPDLIDRLPLTTDSSKLTIGFVSILVFLASLTAWMVDWKGKADAHGRAASAYASTKFRLGSVDSETDSRELDQILMQYEETARSAVPIPDAQFLRLKSEHLLKIRLSRLLDRFPAVPIRFARLRLRLRHTKTAFNQVQPDDE